MRSFLKLKLKKSNIFSEKKTTTYQTVASTHQQQTTTKTIDGQIDHSLIFEHLVSFFFNWFNFIVIHFVVRYQIWSLPI